MTKALADLITQVRERGDLRNVLRFTDAYVTKELQAAFAEGYQIVAKANEGYYDTETTTSTVANQAYVAAPAGSWRILAVDRLEGTEYIPVHRAGVKDRNKFGAVTGPTELHRLTARGIDLYPTPDKVYTLRVIYIPVAPTLDTTQREFYNSWEEYSIYGALVRIYKSQNRDSSEWREGLAAAAALLVDGSDHRDSSGPEYLNLHEPGGADWDMPPTWSW